MAVARTTETKHQWRCHHFWGCGKWSVCLMTILWLPEALLQLHFGISCEMCSGPERKWGSVSSRTTAPLERLILICSWLRVGVWCLFPGDFQPELRGAQAPAHAHTEGRDAAFLAWLLCPATGRQRESRDQACMTLGKSLCFPEYHCSNGDIQYHVLLKESLVQVTKAHPYPFNTDGIVIFLPESYFSQSTVTEVNTFIS